MNEFRDGFRNQRKRLAHAIGFTVLATLTIVLSFNLVCCDAHSQVIEQNASTAEVVYEYEVASIKPTKPDDNQVTRMLNSPDAFTATNVTLMMVMTSAYGVQDYQVLGAPNWANADRYDIEAKLSGSVTDALQKLTPPERALIRQQMLQALLADRFKLTIQRVTKQLPVFTLLIGKGGSKLNEAKPDDAYPNGSHGADSVSDAGQITIGGNPTRQTMTGHAVPIARLAYMLTRGLERPVLDETGLTGNYDFTITFSPDQSQSPQTGGGAIGSAPTVALDSAAPSLSTAVEEQLGLKLQSGKGPVEIIVVDHVERPVGN